MGTFMSELAQKGEMVLIEASDVRDAVLEHGDPFDSQAEGESRVRFRIDPAVLEHPGMHHAAAEDLDPPGPLAHGTAPGAADEAGDVDLGAGLRERKEARSEPDLGPVAPHRFGEQIEDALEMGEGDAGPDDEPL